MSPKVFGAAIAVVLICAACSGGQPDPKQEATSAPDDNYTFTRVVDQTKKPKEYRVDSTATGVTHHFFGDPFSTLTLNITVVNVNQTVFHPTAVIKWSDGSSTTCEETDLRRYPSLNAEALTVDLPCPDLRNGSGSTVTVTDDYN